MPGPRPQPTPIVSKPRSLSNAASSIICRIPQLLGRLHDLENEEAEVDVKGRQLVEQLPDTKDRRGKPSTPARSTIFTPVSKPRNRATVDRGVPRTPPHIDPSMHPSRGLETTLNVFSNSHRDASESFSVDGVIFLSDVDQKQTQGKGIRGRRQY